MESTTIQLKIKNKVTQFTAVYKSPSANLHHNDLNILTNHNGPFIIAGDLKSKHPSWNSLSTNTAGRKLLHHSEANNYTIVAPDSPTHYPYIPTHRPDVLDIILLDLPSIQYTVINHNDLSSDHNPIQLNLNASPISNNPPKTLKKTNWTKFKTELSQIKIDRVKTQEEIDKLTTIIRNAQENASYTLKPKQIISQLPDEIMLEITTKRQLRKMWQSSKNPRTKRLYNAQNTYVKNLLNDHRQTQWNTFTETLNFKNKSLYQLNRRLLKKKAADTPLQTTTGHKIFEADEKAELFADTMEDQFIGNAGIDLQEGSCLSPLLYIQYVNDLPLLDKIQTSIFADNTMFHTAHKNRNYAISQLQRQLDQTVIWIDRWRLKLNIDKTEAIIFGSRQNKHLRQIKIKNQTIKWKNQIKYLGVTMDSKLTMNGHTQTTTQKAKGVRASLYPILNQKSPIPLRTRIQLYTIYIKPILLYASVAWAPQLSQSNWRKLEAVQNIALRTITGAYYLTTNEEIRQSADVRSISETTQKILRK
ncbi:hypothetical protein QTP88_003050 [Uroleucon formosanum]